LGRMPQGAKGQKIDIFKYLILIVPESLLTYLIGVRSRRDSTQRAF
jgi:hypothetical protein